MLQEIGLTVVDNEQLDGMKVHSARELQGILERLRLQIEMIHDQARAAMREKLASLLSPEAVDEISDSEIDAFYHDLEARSHIAIWATHVASQY